VVLLGLAGCSTSDLTVDDDTLAPGHTLREQVEQHFGEPRTRDTASAEGVNATRCAYIFKDSPQDPPEPLRGFWQAPRKELVFEFTHDTLNGYLYNNSVDRNSTDFKHQLRGKILIGRANKAMVDTLLGEPAGKVRLPTSIFDHELLGHLAHIVPTSAYEAWYYYYDYFYFRAGMRKRFEYYKFLVVYFDASGVVVDKFYSESHKAEPRTTRVFAN
jgi:outer membrane protein assembly factor BamE (lipoprotein component of BamABCDE complex)